MSCYCAPCINFEDEYLTFYIYITLASEISITHSVTRSESCFSYIVKMHTNIYFIKDFCSISTNNIDIHFNI